VAASPSWPGLFTDHPIRPVEARDPLGPRSPNHSPRPIVTTGPRRLRVGFACLWEPDPERTWSGSATNLRAALRRVADTVDAGVQIPRLSRTALKAIHTRYRGGRLTTTWCCSRLTDAYNVRAVHRDLSKNLGGRHCDAVLMIDDLAIVSHPFFIYYDSSWDALISSAESADIYAALRSITPSNMARRRDRQLRVYERATGVIAMSHWLARSLVEHSGVSPGKVHVVHPGTSAGGALEDIQVDANSVAEWSRRELARPLPERAAPRRKLLFVGRQYESYDFYRKGGDLVVAALAILRRDYDPQMTLTVVGAKEWPLPGPPPDGVRFLGILPQDKVAALYDIHDLFVMPSRMEPFGIVFAEALARGLPCIARDAYAMPEVVTPGISGALIAKDDEHDLAATIAAILADDQLYETCHARAPEMAAYFSWERAAKEVVQVITQAVGPTS
jgi:glycosyltransferase involved in cell wall biosynthesis